VEEQRQAEIFQAMERPDFYPHPITTIEQRETHISKVFLTGLYVYKIKKPVNLEFLDFTTLEKRQHFCHQEVMLNRRLSRDVYLDVVAITLQGDRYCLERPGDPIEYAVKMRQLPEECSMARLLPSGKIDTEEIEKLVRILAGFYTHAPTGGYINTFGLWKTVWANCEENFRQAEIFVGKILDERIFQIVRAATRSFMRRRKEFFQNRIDRDKIRDCHGDLRAGHVYFTEGIQIIDCIEFNERFRYGDITSDLAFLAMDLDNEGYPQIAQRLLNSYVEHTKDQGVFVLLDFYKCYRAFVRIKVSCFRLEEGNIGEQERGKVVRDIQRCMNLAYRYAVQFTRPILWIICGMPASGKSTIARELAHTLGIQVFRSDLIRKELFGLPPYKQVDLPFEEGIYSKGASSLTCGRLLLLAQEEIEKGCAVVLDATYGSRHERSEVLRLAKDMDANLVFVECVSSEEVLKGRLMKRRGTSLISDARLHHFQQLKARFEPLDEVPREMHIRVDTERPLERSMQQILSEDYVLLSRQTAEAVEPKSTAKKTESE
jgi:aminoglycoside phosphotransferase family enzyme/predicted kinase